MVALITLKGILTDENGDAVVEATILFPIMIMIFAALVVLSAILPTRAALQRATQYTAMVLATERSDTWLFYDLDSMNFYWEKDKGRLGTVYSQVLSDTGDISVRAGKIVKDSDRRFISLKDGELMIESRFNNNVIAKEIIVTATRRINSPINLSFVGFPEIIDITVTSMAVVQDGDEFIRNVDLITDFSAFIAERFGLSNTGEAIDTQGSSFKAIIGR